MVRLDRRRAEQHDPEILGDVARVLDGPREVVAERRVEAGLLLVEELVAGMEEVAGRGEVVEEQRADRDRRSQPGREAPPEPGPAAADEDEERRGEERP